MPIKADWYPFNKETIKLIHPEDTGVYECGYKRGNRVAYIGKGVLRDRLLTHTEEVRFVGVTHFRKRKVRTDEALKAEDKLLEEYKKKYGKYPPLNKIKSSGDPWKGILY